MPAVGSLLTAGDTDTRAPQPLGLDTAPPGSGVSQRVFSPVAAFHFTAVGVPSGRPDAAGPLNDGQFCADSPMHTVNQTTADETIEVQSLIATSPRFA